VRISGVYIDGFGIYHAQSLQDVSDGLILFTGRNEGGKTTLMEFIRTILFGLPKKDRNDYKPLRGGKHGGRLRFILKDGRSISVERFEKKAFVTEDGKFPEQMEPSERFLKGIDRQIFECIFAIGLNDLERLDENVRDKMLASSAGIKVPIPSIMSQIDDKLKGMLLKLGRNPEINQIVRSFAENKKNIKILQGESSKYEDFRRKLEELERQVEKNKAESSSNRKRLDRIKQLEQARSPWVKLCDARNKLDELDYTKNFPPKGLDRFNGFKEDIKDVSKEKDEFDSKVQKIQIGLSNLAVDETIISNQKSIETIRNEREKLNSALNDLPGVKSKTYQEEDKFQKQLKDLGTDWTPERLANVDTSIQTRHRVQTFNHDLESVERKHEQAKISENNLQDADKNSKLSLDDALSKFEACLIPSITNKEELKQKQDTLRKIRSFFHQQENLSIQIKADRGSLQKENDELNSLINQKISDSGQMPSWAWIIASSAGIIMAVILLVLGSYIPEILFILVMAGLSFWLRSNYIRQVKDNAERIRQNQTEVQKHKNRIKQLSENITDFENQIKGISDEIGSLAQDIGFERPDNSDKIDKFEGILEQANETLRDWVALKQNKDNAEKNWQDASERLNKSNQETKKAYEERQNLEKDWKSWIVERGFDETISPEGFEVILQMVENTRTTENSLQGLKSRVDEMEKYISDTRERICHTLETCNMELGLANVGVPEIDTLIHSLNSAIENQKKRDNLQKELVESNRNLEKLNNKLDKGQSEISKLLQKSGATDEEDFFRIAEAYDKWHEFKQILDTSTENLMTIVGNAEALENLETELNETDPLSLMSEKERLESQLNELDDRITRDVLEKGRLEKTLEDMVQDDELSKLLFEQKTLQEQLSDATKRWATLVTIRHLLDQTRSIYERERQPKVIQEATRFINVMTDKSYRLVMPAGDSSDIQLEDTETLSRKSEMGWSSGLADQVYLALRFGMAYDFSEHSEPLPIILDDVLVRFDPDRQLGTAKVILNLAQNHQVFMFTCHPITREIIENAYDETGLRDNVPFTHYVIDDGTIRMM
jgi:uncharacterized protein YhaN